MKNYLLLVFILLCTATNAQNLEWAKTLTGSGSGTSGTITIDKSGNIILGSYFNGSIDLDPSDKEFMVTTPGSNSNSFVAKYTPAGAFLWGGVFTCNETSLSSSPKTTDKDNNVFITGAFLAESDLDPSSGEFLVTPIGGQNSFITKLDSNGSFLWAKTMVKNVYIRDITTDDSGNFYTIGFFNDTVDFDLSEGVRQYISVGAKDAYIAKYDKDGELVWVHTLITEGTKRGVDVTDIELKSSGEVVVAGNFDGTVVFDENEEGIELTSQAQVVDAYFLELNVEGELNWVKHIASKGFVINPRVNLFSQDSIFISGRFNNLTDFDPSPNKKEFSARNSDVFFAKYSPKGDLGAAYGFGHQDYAELAEIVIDDKGSIFMTGNFNGSLGSLKAKGYSDIYFFHSNTRGKFICGRKFGYELDNAPAETDYSYDLHLTKNGNILYYGRFVGEYDMNPNDGETILKPKGASNLVFAEFSACNNGFGTSSIAPLKGLTNLKTYPNPTNGIIQYEVDNVENAIIKITDVFGRKINFIRTGQNTIDISTAANGIYFLSIEIDNVMQISRIVKH